MQMKIVYFRKKKEGPHESNGNHLITLCFCPIMSLLSALAAKSTAKPVALTNVMPDSDLLTKARLVFIACAPHLRSADGWDLAHRIKDIRAVVAVRFAHDLGLMLLSEQIDAVALAYGCMATFFVQECTATQTNTSMRITLGLNEVRSLACAPLDNWITPATLDALVRAHTPHPTSAECVCRALHLAVQPFLMNPDNWTVALSGEAKSNPARVFNVSSIAPLAIGQKMMEGHVL